MMFPGLTRSTGGIQASGADAWNALDMAVNAERIVFDPASDGRWTADPSTTCARSKGRLILKIVSRSWHDDILLCWHLGMLKLLPFLRGFHGKVIQFLHGVECWRTQNGISRRLLNRVDHFFSNSQFTWQRFLQFNPQFLDARHTVTALGLGEPLRGATPPPSGPPAVVMLGRLRVAKITRGTAS